MGSNALRPWFPASGTFHKCRPLWLPPLREADRVVNVIEMPVRNEDRIAAFDFMAVPDTRDCLSSRDRRSVFAVEEPFETCRDQSQVIP